MPYRRARPPAKPNNTRFKAQTYYALRFVQTGLYVDARQIKSVDRNRCGKFYISMPKTEPEPVLNQSLDTVQGALRLYETDRLKRLALSGLVKRDSLEMVTFRTGFTEEDTLATPPVDPLDVRALLIGHHYGLEAYTAFAMARAATDASQYAMFLRRKGGKALMDELMFDNFSYGTITFLRDETELVQARLILGDTTPARVFDIINFPPD